MLKKISLTTWIILVLIAIIIVCCIRMSFLSNKADTANNFIQAMNDTIKRTIDKNGAQEATITAFKADKASLLSEIQTKDSSLLSLQQTVSYYKNLMQSGSSATHATLITDINNTSKTTVVAKDTIEGLLDNSKIIYPEYRSSINMGGWIVGNSIANKDSTKLDLQVKDILDLVVGYDKGKPTAILKTQNPYTTTVELRSMIISPPPYKRLGIGLHLGYGGVAVDGQIKLGFLGSVGINYTLIPIK